MTETYAILVLQNQTPPRWQSQSTFISKVVDSNSIPKSEETKDFNIGIHSYHN